MVVVSSSIGSLYHVTFVAISNGQDEALSNTKLLCDAVALQYERATGSNPFDLPPCVAGANRPLYDITKIKRESFIDRTAEGLHMVRACVRCCPNCADQAPYLDIFHCPESPNNALFRFTLATKASQSDEPGTNKAWQNMPMVARQNSYDRIIMVSKQAKAKQSKAVL